MMPGQVLSIDTGFIGMASARLLAQRITRQVGVIRRPVRNVDVRAAILDSTALDLRCGWQPEAELGLGRSATSTWLQRQP